MTPIFSRSIDDASAWTPRSTSGKEGFVTALSGGHLHAIDEILRKIDDIETYEISRDDFRHPLLDPVLAAVRREVMQGKCAAIVTGVDTQRFSQRECERIFWGFGTHLGYAAVQSNRGDRIGYVREEPNDPVKRGYRSSSELVLHTDSRAIVALMCLQPAESGGVSSLASSATIHNVILRERPDLLEPLYRGHRYHSGEVGITPCAIPVLSNVDGFVSCMFFEDHIRKAAATLGTPLARDMEEALNYFAEVAKREDVSIDFMLEPGEMIFCNNFVVLHARTEFRNSPARQRLLARLWLNVADGRPTLPELHWRADWYDRNYDPKYVPVERT
jgi:hypothetical protein